MFHRRLEYEGNSLARIVPMFIPCKFFIPTEMEASWNIFSLSLNCHCAFNPKKMNDLTNPLSFYGLISQPVPEIIVVWSLTSLFARSFNFSENYRIKTLSTQWFVSTLIPVLLLNESPCKYALFCKNSGSDNLRKIQWFKQNRFRFNLL